MRSATISPGGTLTLAAGSNYLIEPKLTVTVKVQTKKNKSTSNLAGADVRVADACGATYPSLTSNSSGKAISGYPFGALTVCADNNSGYYALDTVTNAASGSTLTLQIDTWDSNARGSCT